MKRTKEQALEMLLNAIPNAHTITDWDLSSEHIIQFKWKGVKFRFDFNSMFIETIKENALSNDGFAVLLEALLIKVERELYHDN